MTRRDRAVAWLRSPRVAAYGVGLTALVLLVTVTVGAVGAVRDTSRLASLEIATLPGGDCRDRVCTVGWTVRSPDGPAQIDRLTFTDFGPGAPREGRALVGLRAGGEERTLPDFENMRQNVQNVILALVRDVAPGSPVSVRARVSLAEPCPAGGYPDVVAILGVSAGGVQDQVFLPEIPLPCP